MAVFRIITVMLILAGSLAGLLFGMTYIFDQSLDNPDVLMHAAISGNDIIVTIYEGGRVNEMTQLSLEIEGYSPVVQERSTYFGTVFPPGYPRRITVPVFPSQRTAVSPILEKHTHLRRDLKKSKRRSAPGHRQNTLPERFGKVTVECGFMRSHASTPNKLLPELD